MESNILLIFLAAIICLGLFVRNVRPWFFGWGCTGIFVAMAVVVVRTMGICISPKILLVIWFPAFLGLAEPATAGQMAQTLAIHFLGNFLLYAIVGTVIGLGIEVHRRERRRGHPPSRSAFSGC